jgi:predicted AAA+ superfamily ATPase
MTLSLVNNLRQKKRKYVVFVFPTSHEREHENYRLFETNYFLSLSAFEGKADNEVVYSLSRDVNV